MKKTNTHRVCVYMVTDGYIILFLFNLHSSAFSFYSICVHHHHHQWEKNRNFFFIFIIGWWFIRKIYSEQSKESLLLLMMFFQRKFQTRFVCLVRILFWGGSFEIILMMIIKYKYQFVELNFEWKVKIFLVHSFSLTNDSTEKKNEYYWSKNNRY